ncbi:MAG: hypoxanthine phosphoribosyltransferase [Nitrospirae bacterium]|nr:hypoxanthine phosphoribosyltransferase [Nitrospirota bacterium]
MIIGRPFLTTEQIQHKVKELASIISNDYAGKDLLAVCILRGAFMFFSDIVRAIKVPVTVDFLIASSYLKTETTGEVKIYADLSEIPLDYVGFKIPNEYVVGYGLDYENKFRNLPYIAIFKKSI